MRQRPVTFAALRAASFRALLDGTLRRPSYTDDVVIRLALFFALSAPAWAQLNCNCDADQPETLKARECSLCVEVEKHDAAKPVILVKDINPRKPNRWLALPRVHAAGPHRLEDLTADQRTALWTTAIEKAKTEWGDRWAIAMNGQRVRTQCHMHVHIGRMLDGVEAGNFMTAASPSDIPLPGDGGFWIHPLPDSKTLHVHLGEQVTETVLLR